MTDADSSDLTRRRFLGAMAAAPVAVRGALGDGPAPGGARRPRVAVVGAGAFGGWTALHLLRRGADVTLVDAWGPGNPRSSSGGEGRAIRAIYGPDRIYSEMVRRSFELWEGLEGDSGERLYDETGALWMISGDDGYVRDALPILEELGFPVEEPSRDEAAARWPQIDLEGIRRLVLERRAGVLWARRACRVVRDRFVAEGGAFRIARAEPGEITAGALAGLRFGDGSRLDADRYVFACGPWLGRLFPDAIGDGVRPTRQEVHYFGVPAGSTAWGPERLPIWVDFGATIFYGFPDVHGRGFKVADDTRGAEVDPTDLERAASFEAVAAARRFLGRRFPALAAAPLVEARVCQYENSPDGDLILDRHPAADNLWLAGGGSGHGFKLAPAVGELLAAMVLDGRPTEERFGLARLQGTGGGATQFDKGGAR